jgi:hypothetical protein
MRIWPNCALRPRVPRGVVVLLGHHGRDWTQNGYDGKDRDARTCDHVTGKSAKHEKHCSPSAQSINSVHGMINGYRTSAAARILV